MSIMGFINPFGHCEFCPYRIDVLKTSNSLSNEPCTCGLFPWDQPGIPACKTQEEFDERRKKRRI